MTRTRGTLVGRNEELSRLTTALTDAAAGVPRVLVLAGEAGVGKSRLAAEWADLAGAAGAASATAVCVDLRDGILPYGPVAQLLRLIGRQLGTDAMAALTADAPPELVPLLPAAYRGRAAADLPTSPGRLFERLLELLDAAAAIRPLALCVDDLHWADPGTLDFVRYLSRSLSTERLALLLTYRPEDAAADVAVEDALTDLGRAADLVLTVPPFTAEEVAARLADLLDSAPAPELAERLHGRTGGNPYFLEELVAAGAFDERTTPATLRALLTQRLRALAPDTRSVLRLMAVAGRACASAELAAAGILPPGRLDGALREALARRLVVRTGEGWSALGFRHPLLREALADEIPPEERRSLHRGWAGALDRCGEPDAAMRARHWDAAGEVAEALVARVRAADDAAAVTGFPQAWQHWQRALELWRQADAPAVVTGLDEATLLERAADAARWAGQPENSITLLNRALELPEVHDSPLRLGALLESLSRCQREAGHGEQARGTAERAAATLAGQPPSPVRSRVVAGQAAAALVHSRYRDAMTLAGQAIRLAETCGATAEAGHAHNTLGVALAMTGEVDDGLAALNRARRIAERQGAVEDRLRAANNLSFAYMNAGRYREALAAALAGFQLARRHHRAATAGALLLTNAATALVWLGEWHEADTLAEEALAEPGPDGFSAALHLTRAEVAVGTGRFDAAEQHLDRAGRLAVALDEPQLLGHVAACRAELLLWRGAPTEAGAVAEEGLADAQVGEDDQLALRLCALGLRAAADQAEVDTLRRRAAARDGAERLRGTAEKLLAALPGTDAFPEARADAATADAEVERAEAAAAKRPADPQPWLRAAQCWTALHRPSQEAYCRWRAAEALLAARTPRPARAALSTAYAGARALGAAPLVAEIEALARRARLDLAVPSAPTRTPSSAGLTEREREVLILICDGLTNRQLARQLFISEKTASVHVSRIMAKLDVPTRGAAAAAARRLGLVPAEPAG